MSFAHVPPLPANPLRQIFATAPSRPASAPAVDSRALLGGAREIEIHHGGAVYRLRHTRNDKLILVK